MNVFDLAASLTLDKKNYEDGLNQAEGKAESSGNKIGNAFANFGKVAVAGFAAVGTAAATATTAFVKSTGQVAEYGDNIDKMSQKLGISATAYQEWDAIMQHSGTSIDSMTGAMKTMSVQAEKGNDAFQKLGISQEEMANMNQEELFSKVIAGLQGMEEGTERTALATQLLGRGAVELGPLLNTSAEDTEAMRQKVHELGGVMSDDAVKAAAAYQDSLQDMKTAMSGVKRNLVSEFLPSVTTVMNGLQEVLSGNGDEGVKIISQGVDDLLRNLTEAVPKFLEIGGKIIGAIFDAIIDNLPKIIEVGTQVLLKLVQGIIEKLPDIIKAGLEIIVTLIDGITQALPDLIDTIVEVIIEIAEALTNPSTITSIIQAGIQLILALVDGLVKAIPQLVSAIPTIIKNLIQAIIQALPSLIQGAIQLVIGIVEALPEIITALIEALPMIIEAIVEGLIVGLPMLIQGAIQLVIALVEHMPEIIKALIEAIPMIIEAIITAFSPIVEMLAGVFSQAWEGIKSVFSAVGGWFKERFQESYNNVTTIWDAITGFFSNIWEGIKSAFSAVGDWFKERFETAKNNATGAWDNIKSVFSGIWQRIKSGFNIDEAWTWGKDMIDNFVDGINGIISKVGGAMASVGEAIINGIKHLPESMLNWGKDMIQGLIDGIKGMISKVGDAVKGVADKIKNFLHFSRPDEGPLREYEKWMPDMIRGLTSSLDKASPSLINKVKDLASDMSDSLKIDGTVNAMSELHQIPEDFDPSGGSSKSTGGGATYIINVNQPVSTPDEMANAIRVESQYGLIEGVPI